MSRSFAADVNVNSFKVLRDTPSVICKPINMIKANQCFSKPHAFYIF